MKHSPKLFTLKERLLDKLCGMVLEDGALLALPPVLHGLLQVICQ